MPPSDDYVDSEDETSETEDPPEDTTKEASHRMHSSPINNQSDIEGLFISGPAYWSEGHEFRTRDQGADLFRVLSLDKHTGDGLFPLHNRCLNILRYAIAWHIEYARQPPSPSLSLMGVYKFLCSQRKRNLVEMYRIANQEGINSTSDYASYGLEYKHNYYGARRFWTSEGWEVYDGITEVRYPIHLTSANAKLMLV
ncbi:hypothetical protein G7Z17_g7744 [Cylindrodendrum hubeiense]|uniref:Uncharacterized protein n=1 Tax=Cylindrodendrum hubeiense TaxID=595255 RepID=A0A9P5H9Z1_9HYPO|nr:hypothetical protein G7Z17_g7744 [Cylindrodendrum hubeiense]